MIKSRYQPKNNYFYVEMPCSSNCTGCDITGCIDKELCNNRKTEFKELVQHAEQSGKYVVIVDNIQD